MSISFNNIPTTVRTPGTYTEVNNSRALQNLVATPHKALIIGQKNATGANAANLTIQQITRDNLADGYFGTGSLLARMCNVFKKNNPNTELHAISLSGGTAQASARIHFSAAISHAGFSCSSGNQQINLLINGKKCEILLTSSWSMVDIASACKTYISNAKDFSVTASVVAASGVLVLSALNSGTHGNYFDVRANYFTGQSNPTFFADSILISNFAGGLGSVSLDDAWSVIDNEQYQYVITPYIDSTNLLSLETELANRFKPLVDKWGHGITAFRGTTASCTTLGNSRNSPHNTMFGVYDTPNDPAEWAAGFGAQIAWYLNQDPARPLTGIQVLGLLAPPSVSKFTQTERDTLLYDGIATWITDSSDNVLIERAITTYQTNSLGVADSSYLDIQTLATLSEIRYQFKSRMTTRFIVPRFKLADDSFPVQPGQYVATPSIIRQEIIALFTALRDQGLIEDLQDFIDNLLVQRNSTDPNRVDCLLPPNLINQFNVLAGLVEFIL